MSAGVKTVVDLTAPVTDVERACAYVIDRVRATSGALFHQGARMPPLVTRSVSPWVRFIAEERLHRVSTAVVRALVLWADGFPVELLTDIPTPGYVLALQSRGRRCVSLLPPGTDTRPHDGPFAFTVHDLCHLEKFADSEHHNGQVGFFASFEQAVHDARWGPFEALFDPSFTADWQHVAADMNGSAVFLFAALKMKLKMAVRRRVAFLQGGRPDLGGQLTPAEASAYAEHLETLLVLLRLHGDVAEAARRTSARRDDPTAAWTLLQHFERVGDDVLRSVTRPSIPKTSS
jgi:hypothetical protein